MVQIATEQNVKINFAQVVTVDGISQQHQQQHYLMDHHVLDIKLVLNAKEDMLVEEDLQQVVQLVDLENMHREQEIQPVLHVLLECIQVNHQIQVVEHVVQELILEVEQVVVQIVKMDNINQVQSLLDV